MTEQQNREAFGNCMRSIYRNISIKEEEREFGKSGTVVGGAGGCGERKDVPEYVKRAYDIVVEEG